MSRLPKAVQKAKEAAEAMQKELANTGQLAGEPEAQPTQPAAGIPNAPAPDTTQTAPTPGNDLTLDKPLGDDDARWEQRYKILQGKYNKEVPALHEEIKALKQQVSGSNPGELQRLRDEITELKNRPQTAPETLSTPDLDALREEFPPQLVDGLLAVMKGMVEPVQRRLDTVDQTVSRTNQDNRVDRLRQTLRAANLDFDQLNTDPLFTGEFLQQRDPYSGKTRHELLSDAFAAGDIDRAARFFTDYAGNVTQETSAGSASKPSLEKHVTVPTTATSAAPTAQEVPWSEETIAQFYENKRRGKYTPEEAARLEANLFASMPR